MRQGNSIFNEPQQLQHVLDIINRFDNVAKRIDAVDKGSKLNCQQKWNVIQDFLDEFNDKGLKR